MLKIFLLIFFANFVFSANILYVGEVVSPSHYIWNKALALGLVEKGHNVTLIAPDEDNKPLPKNLTRIVLNGVYEALHSDELSSYNDFAQLSPYATIQFFQDWCTLTCQELTRSKGLQKILDYPSDFKFDVIIFDVTTGTCLLPLLKKFNYPPAVGVTAFLLPTYNSLDYGNFLYPSFIPWYSSPYTTDMSFWERLWNFFYTYVDTLAWQQLYEKLNIIGKQVFGEDTPSYHKLQKGVSLLLANSDPLLDYAQPVPPNIILIGGLHAQKTKKLPNDLQQILDKAKDGVIVFSLGTNVRSDQLGNATIQAFLDVFRAMNHTILWKFESNFENLPKNVIVRKWLPQNDLLGHANVKLFIGHGGALSTQESIFHEVPMIIIPFFVDQHVNAKTVIKKQLGGKMDVDKLDFNYIQQNLHEVLHNKKYSENVRKVSRLFKDRLATPMQRAVFWIEYVMRNKGAEYLSSSIRNMKYYEALNVDVLIFLLAVVLISFFALIKIVKFGCKFISSTTDTSTKIKTN